MSWVATAVVGTGAVAGAAGSASSKGKGGKSNLAQLKLSNIAEALFNESTPLRRTLLTQGKEAADTGGVTSQIPLINRLIEGRRSALSTSMRDTEGRLAASGLARTPFGQSTLANLQIGGESEIADIGPKTAAEFLKMLVAPTFNQSGQVVSAASGAAGAESTVTASENQARAQILSRSLPQSNFGYSVQKSG